MYMAAMDLATWLTQHEMTDAAFAEQVGCNQKTINRARRGLTMPEAGLIERIEEATAGKVTVSDLFSAVRAAKRTAHTAQPSEAA